jgi:hypothetical protein
LQRTSSGLTRLSHSFRSAGASSKALPYPPDVGYHGAIDFKEESQ